MSRGRSPGAELILRGCFLLIVALAMLVAPIARADDAAPVDVMSQLTAQSQAKAEKIPDGLQVTAKGTVDNKVLSKDSFKVPLIIEAKLKIESNSAEICYGPRGLYIFNSIPRTTELRYKEIRTGRWQHISDQGAIAPETLVDVKVSIYKDESRVEVDGQLRGVFKSNNSGIDGFVGVTTSDGQTLTLESMTVTKLDDSATAPPDQPGDPIGIGSAASAPSAVASATPSAAQQASNTAPQPANSNAVLADGQIDASNMKLRIQSSIHALYVREETSGEMLGEASALILTATPDSPRDNTAVGFTTTAGPEMHTVLDEDLRYLHAKYARWPVSKVDLSFEDKYTPKDGGSIGAAIGTLLLSMFQDFEIDPNLAITGDISADGRLDPIGGVSAKIRGATEAGCNIVVLPTENYDQLCDAFVYEGPTLVTNMNVIGAANLDEAASIARTDRADDLKQAIELFTDVQTTLKANPKAVTTKAVSDKLASIVKLAPNDYSAKLLYLTSQNKQPKKLSAVATEYYSDVAVSTMLPSVLDAKKKVQVTIGTSAQIQEGLRKIQKVRWYANPALFDYVVSVQDFMQSVADAQNGRATAQDVQQRAQKVIDEQSKIDSDRDLVEKMLHEGI